MTDDAHIVLAVIGAAHGIKGEVRVKTYLEDPMDLGAYGVLTLADGRQLTVAGLRYLKDEMVVARFEQIKDRTMAEQFNGLELSVDRAKLPALDEDDTYYHADLIGLQAVTASGDLIGHVQAIYDFGAGDMLEVRPLTGGSVLFPFTRQVVPQIDLALRRVVIHPPLEVEGAAPEARS